MDPYHPTYAQRTRVPAHRSFFRQRLASRAPAVGAEQDQVQEHLIAQANHRGFFGAYSPTSGETPLDAALTLEEIVVGLLQPQAPAEGRVLKLVLRILQSGKCDSERLLLLARRERADVALAWLVSHVPDSECTHPIKELCDKLSARPPRERRVPALSYDWRRLEKNGRPR